MATGTMNTVALSVIVPYYNVASYIDACLKSLLDQTCTNFEVFCIDDCSTDSSRAKAYAAAGNDSRFHFIDLPQNGGQAAARNAALDKATGEYVIFLDSDDYLVPHALETLLSVAHKDNLDNLYFTAHTFYENKKLEITHPEDHDNRIPSTDVMTGADLLVTFVKNDSFRPSACFHIIKLQTIRSNGLRFEEGIIHEDLLWTLQVMPRAQRARYIDESLYMRRMRAGSTMTTRRGIKNLHGLLHVAYTADNWLRSEKANYQMEFIECYGALVGDTLKDAACDVASIYKEKPEELAAYSAALPEEIRNYYLCYVEPFGRKLTTINKDFYSSYSYRVGHALICIPSAIKERLAKRS